MENSTEIFGKFEILGIFLRKFGKIFGKLEKYLKFVLFSKKSEESANFFEDSRKFREILKIQENFDEASDNTRKFVYSVPV